MKNRYKKILSCGDTVGGKQVQHDKVRDCRATLAMTRGEQSGRSMVEMLGVLAVIGVLSVAGIAGYISAMRSYRTNEIVNAVSTLYVMGMAQNQGAGDQELVYAGNIATNNPSGVTNLKYTTSKTVTMTISDADDCAMVKTKLGDKITGECASLTVTFGEAGTVDIQKETEESCISKNKYWVINNENCYDTYDDASDYCVNIGSPGYSGNEEGGTSGVCV